MPKYPKNYHDVEFFSITSKRRKKIAGSTKAVSDFLVTVHEEHPAATISELREMLTDRTMYICQPDAVAVLDAYIRAGDGDRVPCWK